MGGSAPSDRGRLVALRDWPAKLEVPPTLPPLLRSSHAWLCRGRRGAGRRRARRRARRPRRRRCSVGHVLALNHNLVAGVGGGAPAWEEAVLQGLLVACSQGEPVGMPAYALSGEEPPAHVRAQPCRHAGAHIAGVPCANRPPSQMISSWIQVFTPLARLLYLFCTVALRCTVPLLPMPICLARRRMEKHSVRQRQHGASCTSARSWIHLLHAFIHSSIMAPTRSAQPLTGTQRWPRDR